MGLALTQHLLSKQDTHWRVVLADINEDAYKSISSALDPKRTMFQRTDVSSWEDNANLFEKAFEWSSSHDAKGEGRIDFFAANAGTGNRESVFAHFDLNADPVKPDLKTLEVDLVSVFHGLKLFIHYARKTRAQLPSSVSFTPSMVITASAVGLYPMPSDPQYCAAKHGLVGLTRSVGPRLLAEDNLSVNAICPGLVATGLPPPDLLANCPKEYFTPMSTILRAHDDLMKEEIIEGKPQRKSGQSLEDVEDQLFYRKPVEYTLESTRWLLEGP
jgi:15-hydroxyprostaglandin dehydrogenase (NAD)